MLDAAAADRKVRAVVIQPESFGGGWAMAQELRDAIARFEASGKPVVAYFEVASNLDYYIASPREPRLMMPSGAMMTTACVGFSVLKGTLDKLGVVADLEHIGAYKSASDMWTRESMSDAQREATTYLLDGLYGRYVGDVAEATLAKAEEVTGAIDEAFFSARRAKELRLVDELRYEDEVMESLEQETGGDVEKLARVHVRRVPSARPWAGRASASST